MPDFDWINNLDLNKTEAKNFFIMDYLNKQDGIMKKEKDQICMKLAKVLESEEKKNIVTHMENFYVSPKPVSLSEARVKNKLDKNIENHIIVCGIVRGIKNLILPLRSKCQTQPRKPIVILSNDNLGDENLNGDTYIWSEINRFEDIYLIKGSALQQGDLEKAKASKATAIIILGKSYEPSGNSMTKNNLDAEAIFMYKTIESYSKSPVIVTELASVGAITFLVQGKNDD
jgi:potassium large conductance calcium-activated channel subfamily M alpha protein 1